MDTNIVMGNDEEIVREYPLQCVRSGRRLEDCSLTVTNKRLIYKRTVKDKRNTSHEVKNIPISSVDTIKSTLICKRKYSLVLIIVSLVMICAGIFLAVDKLRALIPLAWPSFTLYVGIGLLALGAIILLLLLFFTKKRYSFSLAVGYLGGYKETDHIVSGISSLTLHKIRKNSKKRKERFRVNLDYEKLDDLVTEIGALVVRFKNP